MRKIFTLLFALAALMTANAKVVKITLADNTTKVFTTSQLSSIDFNDDGTLTVTDGNGPGGDPVPDKLVVTKSDGSDKKSEGEPRVPACESGD